MKRSRIWIICIVLALLLAIPAAWQFSRSGRSEDLAKPGTRSQAPEPAAGESTNDGERIGQGESRRSVDYAAKAASMLELRAGEVGIIPVPADFLGDLPDLGGGPKDVARFQGMIPKKTARDLIEKALRQGKQIQAKVGPGGDGVGWKSADIGMTASLAGEKDNLFDLLVESSSASGETWKHSVQAFGGSCAVLRYPSGETVMIVIGGSFAVGGVTKEER